MFCGKLVTTAEFDSTTFACTRTNSNGQLGNNWVYTRALPCVGTSITCFLLALIYSGPQCYLFLKIRTEWVVPKWYKYRALRCILPWLCSWKSPCWYIVSHPLEISTETIFGVHLIYTELTVICIKYSIEWYRYRALICILGWLCSWMPTCWHIASQMQEFGRNRHINNF